MSGLHATIVGSSPAIPRAGRSCSAYLIEAGHVPFVIDFGSGAFASLRRILEPETIGAVVISHMHADHFIDLIPFRYYLKYGARANRRKIPLYLPPGGEALLRRLTDAFVREPEGDFLGEVYDLRTYDPSGRLALGEAMLRFAPTTHYIPTYAVRCDRGAVSVTFSSDTAPCEAVVALARATDLFICEATLPPGAVMPGAAGHSTAAEAGAMASAAGVRRLVLSHWPAETTPEELEREARATFAGSLAVADDLDRFDVVAAPG